MNRGIGSFIFLWYMVAISVVSAFIVINKMNAKQKITVDDEVEIIRKLKSNR